MASHLEASRVGELYIKSWDTPVGEDVGIDEVSASSCEEFRRREAGRGQSVRAVGRAVDGVVSDFGTATDKERRKGTGERGL